jgi:anti-sigma-K factor RskA
MTHAEMPDELYDLYVLGALDPAERHEIDTHLREGCSYCSEKLQQATPVVAAMAAMVEPVQPPARLREKVLAIAAPASHKPVGWKYAAIALAAACVILGIFALWAGTRNVYLRQQLAAARTDLRELRAAVSFMSRGDTRTVEFGGGENVPRGRVFVSRTGGVVFIGSRLPSLASNRAFELWVVPSRGAPRPAGVFTADAFGESVDVAPSSVNTSGAAAIAVSIEPAQGSSAPTTKPFLVVPIG